MKNKTRKYLYEMFIKCRVYCIEFLFTSQISLQYF